VKTHMRRLVRRSCPWNSRTPS